MSIKLTFGSKIVTVPESGSAPNWANGIVSAFQAIAQQLQGIVSTFDIPPSVQVLATDTNSNLNIQNGVFPSDQVRSFNFTYAIYKTNGVISIAEKGTLGGVYDTLNSFWILTHVFSGPRQTDGTAYNTFTMTGNLLQLSTAPIGGAYDSTQSRISYAAKTLLTRDL